MAMETASIEIFVARDGKCFLDQGECVAYDASMTDEEAMERALKRFPELHGAVLFGEMERYGNGRN